MTLYNLTIEYMQLLENDEEITSEDLQNLLNLEEHISIKAENISKLIKNLEGDNLALSKEVARLSSSFKINTNKIKTLKDYLLTNMQIAQINQIKSSLFNVSIYKNPLSVEVIDEDTINEKYKTYKTACKIDKISIIKDFKEDGEVPTGVKIIQDGINLRIK